MWEKAFSSEDLPEGRGRCFSHARGRIGVFRTEEGLFAMDNTCPHYDAELHMGEISGNVVKCPWHRWRFYMKDGTCETGDHWNVAVYPVKEEHGFIWIDVAAAKKKERGDVLAV